MLSQEVIRRILGSLTDEKMAEILKLSPALADVEAAAMCLAGDHDVLVKSAHHMSSVVEDIIGIVSDDEEEPQSR
jgi:hypothetical protein